MNKEYYLEERTAKFLEDIIALCKRFKMNPITTVIITQLIKSSTSIGANYAEMEHLLNRILGIKSISARKNQKKLCTGC